MTEVITTTPMEDTNIINKETTTTTSPLDATMTTPKDTTDEKEEVAPNNDRKEETDSKQPDNSQQHDDNNKCCYELQVQEKYLRQERPACLGPLPECVVVPRGKKRKKRPRDKRAPMSEKLCIYLIQGKEDCPHGESCKFSHDVKQFLLNKEDDLSERLSTQDASFTCPQYIQTGFCKFGITCRLGQACHVTKDGKNLIDEAKQNEAGESNNGMHASTKNVIHRNILNQLRKKQYPFKCPRNAGTKKGSPPEIQKLLQEIQPALHDKPRKTIDWNDKVYIAPLTTVGNLPFRRIMKQLGADITCGEMAVVGPLLEGRQSEWSLLKRHESEDVFGIQLAAGYADQLTRISEVIGCPDSNMEIDFVDLNLGCPLDLICNKGAGASLMLHANRLQPSLIGMVNSLGGVPITIKMRTGWETSKPIAHSLVQKIHSWGVQPAAMFVHGRSRLQRYSKEADWDYVTTQVAQAQSDIPIIGNGDLFSYQDYKTHVLDPIETSTDTSALSRTAMLARGALIKPWLATEIKEARVWDISATERLDILRKFCHYGLEQWGSDTQGVNTTRRFVLEWLSFLHRYIPVGLLKEGQEQQSLNQRPPTFMEGRSDLETLFLSPHCHDWIQISERLLGPVPEGFQFEPKHKANSYSTGNATKAPNNSW